MKRSALFCLLCLVPFCWALPWAHAADITVQDPWIREAPPTATMLAAYMVIHNSGKQPLQLLAATSADFDSVEIHQTTMHQGMMQMKAVKGIPITPGAAAVLEPGGYHLMLIGPHRPVRSGDQFTLQLHFDQSEDLAVSAVVRKREK
jgi:copper(I)-binding protein